MQDKLLGTKDTVENILHSQRKFFNSGATLDLSFRKSQLNKIKTWLISNKLSILKSLQDDLSKPYSEAFTSEWLTVKQELDHCVKHLKKWMQKKTFDTPLTLTPSDIYSIYEPKGCVLILSPWNYPFQLSVLPLVAGIASGNCVCIKPSELSPHCNQILKKMVEELFDPSYVCVVEGGAEIADELCHMNFDHIFFTGSTAVGKKVMRAASENLSSLSLELGGKSPCIVDKNVDLDRCAHWILWAKCFNAGQTCIAPDFLWVHKTQTQSFIEALKKKAYEFFGNISREDDLSDPPIAKIISKKHFSRLERILEKSQGTKIKLASFSPSQIERCFFEPHAILLEDEKDVSMQEEIFGPILPILEFEDEEELIHKLQNQDPPLALYVFSEQKKFYDKIVTRVRFGGGCINDALVHVACPELAFGGVKNSGQGRYHGYAGFCEFSNLKSIVESSLRWKLPRPMPPFKGFLQRMISKLLEYL